MDIQKMLNELREERESIDEAIMTLERLAQGRGARRGRPPAWLADIRRRDAGGTDTAPAPKPPRKRATETS